MEMFLNERTIMGLHLAISIFERAYLIVINVCFCFVCSKKSKPSILEVSSSIFSLRLFKNVSKTYLTYQIFCLL